MSAAAQCVRYGKREIAYTGVRRQRQTLEIVVEPDATVMVTAPAEASDDAIGERVRKRAAWILRQQQHFGQYMPQTPERRFVPGETHLYLGRQYRLKTVASSQTGVTVVRGFIIVQSCKPKDSGAVRRILVRWYCARAREIFQERLETVLAGFPDPEGFRPKGLIVRQMRRRWGSLSPSGRLLLNRRLIEAPIDGIDYVVAHELCHMATPRHDRRFFELLEQVMPDWPRRKGRLEHTMA